MKGKLFVLVIVSFLAVSAIVVLNQDDISRSKALAIEANTDATEKAIAERAESAKRQRQEENDEKFKTSLINSHVRRCKAEHGVSAVENTRYRSDEASGNMGIFLTTTITGKKAIGICYFDQQGSLTSTNTVY